MPAVASPATWRTHPHAVEAKAFILNPTVVISRRINTSTFTYPVTYFDYDNPDANGGDPTTDVNIGMTVRIKDGTTEAVKGWARVHTVPSATQIYISPTSQNVVTFANNDIIEILNDYRLWSKIPRILPDGTIYKNWDIRWGSAASSMPPVANTSPWYIGEVLADIITVEFDGTASYANASSASISSYLWDVDDGTITVGTAASSTITATFPAGNRWVSLTVTDSNGETHTAYCLVVAMDDDALSVEVGLSGSLENGWTAGLKLLEDDVSNYPEGAAVMIYVTENYGATAASQNGYNDREHIWFTGWLTNDKVHVEPFEDDWDVVAESAMGILDALPAFSMTLVHNASPATWFDVAGLDWWKCTNHFILWNSSLAEVCDVVKPTHASSYDLHTYESSAGSLKSQFSDLAAATGGLMTVDRNGRVYFRRRPHLLNTGERAAQTTTIALAASDWTDGLDINVRHRPEVGAIIGYGLIASTASISAVKSAAPGTAPGQGGQMMTMNRQVVQTQVELNDRVGKEYAQRNLTQRGLPIRILNGGLIADPAWQEWITFTLASTTNKRQLALTAAKFALRRVSVSFNRDEFSMLEDWELERTLDDEPGDAITIQMPGEDPPGDNTEDYVPSDGTWPEQTPPPYDDYIAPPFEPDVVSEPPVSGAGVMLAWGPDLYISTELGDASPTWTTEFDPGAGWAIIDAIHSSASDVPGDDLRMWAVAFNSGTNQSRIYYNNDVLGVGSWTTQQTLSTTEVEQIRHVAGVADGEGVIVKVVDTSSTAADVLFSDDNFATYNTITLAGSSTTPGGRFDSDDFNLGVIIVAVDDDVYYTTAYSDASGTALSGITALSTSSHQRTLIIPYRKILTQQLNNDVTALQFIISCATDVSGATTWVVTFNASTGAIIAEVNITPVISGTTYAALFTHGFYTAGGNSQIMLMLAAEEGLSSPKVLLQTEDGGATWVVAASGVNYSTLFWLDGTTGIAIFTASSEVDYSNDKGDTMLDQLGDITTGSLYRTLVYLS